MKDPTRKSFVADLAASSRLAKANSLGDEPATPTIGEEGEVATGIRARTHDYYCTVDAIWVGTVFVRASRAEPGGGGAKERAEEGGEALVASVVASAEEAELLRKVTLAAKLPKQLFGQRVQDLHMDSLTVT